MDKVYARFFRGKETIRQVRASQEAFQAISNTAAALDHAHSSSELKWYTAVGLRVRLQEVVELAKALDLALEAAVEQDKADAVAEWEGTHVGVGGAE